MLMLYVGNALRANNLINATVGDVRNEEYKAYIMKSETYKTSLLYGEKVILVGHGSVPTSPILR